MVISYNPRVDCYTLHDVERTDFDLIIGELFRHDGTRDYAEDLADEAATAEAEAGAAEIVE